MKIKTRIILMGMVSVMSLISCNDTEREETLPMEVQLGLSLESPNNVPIAPSLEELATRIAPGKHNVSILDIQYIDLADKADALAARIEYSVNGVPNNILLVRNIENINFEAGTVLKFERDLSQKVAAFSGDIYISCLGPACCYASGTINPDTGELTTSCKCEGGANNQCVMRVSDTPPNP